MLKKAKKEGEALEVMPVDFSLLPGEKVTHHLGSFFLTDKRLVRSRRSLRTMRVADWRYDHIKGVQELDVHPFLLLSTLFAISLYIWWHYFFWVKSWQVALVCIAVASLGLLYKQRRVIIMFRDRTMVHVPPASAEDCDSFAAALRKHVFE
jgi:hypothetical protein